MDVAIRGRIGAGEPGAGSVRETHGAPDRIDGVTTRMFLAVRPDQATRTALLALPRPHEPGVRWVPPEQWHVTLRFWPHGDPAEVVTAMDSIADHLTVMTPVTAELGPVVSRLGRNAVVVPVSGVDGLAELVRSATAHVPPPMDPRPFTGHLTLARLRHRAACGVAGHPVQATFPVTEVELVESELRQDGAVHGAIDRWRVGGPVG